MSEDINGDVRATVTKKNRFLIVLMGRMNAGKTATLKELVNLLKIVKFTEYNNAKDKRSSSKRITLKGSLLNNGEEQVVSVGLDGDVAKNIEDNFAEFDASQADFCVTAVRLFGTNSEKKLREEIKKRFKQNKFESMQFTQIIYLIKPKDEVSSTIQQQANIKMANHIFEGMKKAMEDGQFSIQDAQAATIITDVP